MKIFHLHSLPILIMLITSCQSLTQQATDQHTKGTFGYDREFILKHDTGAVVLGKGDAQIIVSAKYQAKVFTSTASGEQGKSFGWVNYKAFGAPPDEHMNAYGGENRFWLGPEGGRYSVFFEKGKDMTFDNWRTPAGIDSEAWQLLSKNDTSVVMQKNMELTNYAGTALRLRVDRKIKMLDTKLIGNLLDVSIPANVAGVAYRTENTVTNTGKTDWTEQTGMPCTWILDMFPPSDKTTIIIPYKSGTGAPATTNYFGEIPPGRIHTQGSVILFKADGKHRSKLGVHPHRVKNVAGSYDAEHQVLTIIQFDIDPSGKYLNQEWRTDKPAFSGDAMNAYNDGPVAGGKQMGPFYELESVSTAHFLPANQSATHKHSVFHFTGNEQDLNHIAEKVLGVNLSTAKAAL